MDVVCPLCRVDERTDEPRLIEERRGMAAVAARMDRMCSAKGRKKMEKITARDVVVDDTSDAVSRDSREFCYRRSVMSDF